MLVFRFNMKYALLVFISFGLWIYSLTEPKYSPVAMTNENEYNFPALIAHKALTSDKFPGNSLSAVLQTLNTKVGGIEVDIRLSKDNVLFLFHGVIDWSNILI